MKLGVVLCKSTPSIASVVGCRVYSSFYNQPSTRKHSIGCLSIFRRRWVDTIFNRVFFYGL